jgi:hypothetical protein
MESDRDLLMADAVHARSGSTGPGDDLVAILAREFLGLHTGDRIPTVRAIAKHHGVGVGSAHGALARIEEMGAVEVDRRGRNGAFLRRRNVGTLWFLAEREPLIVALPLPNTPHCNGLATAVTSLLRDAHVRCYCAFIRGSRQRLQALRDGRCHVAVMSALAAEERLPTEAIALELPVETLVAEHRVYYLERQTRKSGPVRVMLDRDSADFERLAEIEFRDNDVTFVEGTYNQLGRLLRDDLADAGIWDVEEGLSRLPPPILSRPLSDRSLAELRGRNTRATFVVRGDEDPVRYLVGAVLDPQTILGTQREVISGDRIAEY